MSGRRWSKKTEKIEVRLSPETKQALHETCEARNESASSVIRRLIEDYVARFHVPGAAKPLQVVRRTPVWARWMAAMAASVGLASLALLPSGAETDWEKWSYERRFNDDDGDGQVTLEQYLAWEESKFRKHEEAEWEPIQLDAELEKHKESVAELSSFDVNADGVLEGEEILAFRLGSEMTMFDERDSNGDEILTVDEYLAYAFEQDADKVVTSPQQFIPSRDLDHAKAIAYYKFRFAGSMDWDNDKRVDRDEYLQRRASSYRRSIAFMDPMQIPKQFEYARYDANGDGILAENEALAKLLHDRGKAFSEYDSNGDNILTLNEYTAYKTQKNRDLQERSFHRIDANHDQLISPEEMHSPESLKFFYASIMSSCNISLDPELFAGSVARYTDQGDLKRAEKARERQSRQTHCRPVRQFYQSDADGDGYLSLDEMLH